MYTGGNPFAEIVAFGGTGLTIFYVVGKFGVRLNV